MRLTKHINQMWKRNRSIAENWGTYLFFVVLRIVLVFIPQPGYVHPDEFFQTTEVMNGDHFQVEHVRSWEFNNTMPLRSIALPFLLFRVPWSFVEFFAIYIKNYATIDVLNSYTYLVFPRLIFCLMSFLNDICMYRLCRLYNLRFEIRLLALGSSWVMLVFGTRTFSNTIEMVLCSCLLYLVAESMIKTNTVVYKKEFLEDRYDKAQSLGERVKIWKLKNSLPAHNFNRLMLISTLCVAGVFNRPTFLIFGFPMVFFWLLRGMGTKTITFKDFNLRILNLCLCAIPSLLFFVFCDSLYYKHLTAGELQMLDVHLENFVFTPWNFLKYNLDAEKTAQHGLHPRYLHMLVNIPLLYNVLGIIALVSFGTMLMLFYHAEYRFLPRAQSIIGLMTSAIFVPLFFLSFINHQEARFLIPLIFPLAQLHGTKLVSGFCSAYPFRVEHHLLRKLYNNVLCTQASAKAILKIWYSCNIALTVFYGFIHQAGVFPLAQHFEKLMQEKAMFEQVHLITSHVYSLPVSFVNIPSSQVPLYDRLTGERHRRPKDFFLYEYGGMDLNKILHKIKLIQSNCQVKLAKKQQTYRMFLALPTSLSDEFAHAYLASNSSGFMDYSLKQSFYPHLSTEAFPHILGRHPCALSSIFNVEGECSKSSLSYGYIIEQFSSFAHQFGLALYEINTKKPKTN